MTQTYFCASAQDEDFPVVFYVLFREKDLRDKFLERRDKYKITAFIDVPQPVIQLADKFFGSNSESESVSIPYLETSQKVL